MGSLVSQFLLESLLVPFAVASLILAATRRFDRTGFAALGPSLALMTAIATAYVLAFGWPSSPALGARTKILIAAIIGALIGLALERRHQRPAWILPAGAVAITVWIGLPALQHGRTESLLLALPIALALLALRLFHRKEALSPAAALPILIALAFGLAAIALFGKTFSLAQISLALASALLALVMSGLRTLKLPSVLLTSAMLLALSTALLLYSEASVLALGILGTTPLAGHLTHRTSRWKHAVGLDVRPIILCLLPAAIAILIARIDAGPISLY